MALRKNYFLIFTLTFFLLTILSSLVCAGTDEGQQVEFKTITVGLGATITTTDPHNHRSRDDQTVVKNWTGALTQTLPDGTKVLDLAKSITQLDELT